MPFPVPLLFIFFTMIIIVVITAASKSQKKIEAAWREAGSTLGLTYDKKQKSGVKGAQHYLEGRYRGFATRVNTFNESNGNSNSSFTRFKVNFPDLGLDLKLKHQHFFANLTRKLTGGRDFVTGDDHFDDAVVVQGNSERALEEFLTPERRQMIRFILTAKRRGNITDSEATFIVQGQVNNPRLLQAELDQLLNLAEALVDEAPLRPNVRAFQDEPHTAPAFGGEIPEPAELSAPRVESIEEQFERERATNPTIAAFEEQISDEPDSLPAEKRVVTKAQAAPSQHAQAVPSASNAELSAKGQAAAALAAQAASLRAAHEAEAARIASAGDAAQRRQDKATQAWAKETSRELDDMAPNETVLDQMSAETPASAAQSKATAQKAARLDNAAANALANELFASGLMSYKVKELFEQKYARQTVEWRGQLKRVTTYTSDLVFKNGGGAKATIAMTPIQDGSFAKDVTCVVDVPRDAEAALKSQQGQDVTFNGTLHSCDGFMRTFFVEGGSVRSA